VISGELSTRDDNKAPLRGVLAVGRRLLLQRIKISFSIGGGAVDKRSNESLNHERCIRHMLVFVSDGCLPRTWN